MPLNIIREDITKLNVDAIVNAANSGLVGGGGVDGAIHRVAGPELDLACSKLNGCKTGDAKYTPGFKSKAKYIIHTVGPVWVDGNHNEETLLRSCYKRSLEIAKELKCESVAFPLISAGVYGYPKDEALDIAIEEIRSFINMFDMSVTLCIFSEDTFVLSEKRFGRIKAFIDNEFVKKSLINDERKLGKTFDERREAFREFGEDAILESNFSCQITRSPSLNQPRYKSIEDALKEDGETFQQALFRLIDAKGWSDVQCYNAANVSSKTFCKIRKNKEYQPSKETAYAFAIALELDWRETKALLVRAGFAFNRSSKWERLVKVMIDQAKFNIDDVNLVLYQYAKKQLGYVSNDDKG